MPIVTVFEFIKFGHTLFALPFALMSYLTACGGKIDPRNLVFILAAMVSARTAAMTFNRIVDRKFDALNPRTKERALVTGRLSLTTAWVLLFVSSCLFIASAWMLGRLPLIFSPFVLAILLFYSYTKRFTDYSHFILGFCLGMSPLGAWIAVRGSFAFAPIVLGIGVLLWVAGFDLIYACQDVESDRHTGLHSMAGRLGVRKALALSGILHVLCIPFFIIFGVSAGFGILFWVGVLSSAVFLNYQHSIVSADDLSRVNQAFFVANGAMSVVLFLAVVVDIYI